MQLEASDLLDDFVQELSVERETFTPTDVETALWSCDEGENLLSSQSDLDHQIN